MTITEKIVQSERGAIMITNDFNKEMRLKSDALRDLGYADSTISLRQRFWKGNIDKHRIAHTLKIESAYQTPHNIVAEVKRGGFPTFCQNPMSGYVCMTPIPVMHELKLCYIAQLWS